MSEILYGCCHCGCGGKTNISKANHKNGPALREPFQFIKNHHCRVRFAEKNSNWKGGNRAFGKNYRMQYIQGHPQSCRNYVLEHRLIAEKALGKPLPFKSVVHHYTDKELVLCEDTAYHMLLHRRQRAYESCGHANWLKCHYCGIWGDPKTENMYVNKAGTGHHHRKCDNAAHVQKRLAKKKNAV